MRTKFFRAPLKLEQKDLPDGSPEGSVQAMFSVFNVVDSSMEVVMPSFFVDGQQVAMAAWGHNWGALPVGKGVIRITPDGAVFDGQFFVNTPQGKAHYDTIKEMGALQEWSFGFRVLDARPGEFDGQEVLFLLKGETFEVSPVLVGDNRETFTLDIKALKDDDQIIFDQKSQRHFIAHMQAKATKATKDTTDVFDVVKDALAGLEPELNQMKEGRAISETRRTRIAEIVSELRKSADDLHVLLRETEPPPKGAQGTTEAKEGIDADEILLSLLEGERIRAEMHGVVTTA